jgi:hypothetical protein
MGSSIDWSVSPFDKPVAVSLSELLPQRDEVRRLQLAVGAGRCSTMHFTGDIIHDPGAGTWEWERVVFGI